MARFKRAYPRNIIITRQALEPGIHHIQDKTAQAGSSNTATVTINSAVGNTLVLYVLGAQTGNNPFALSTVTDSTAGTNTWHYSTQQQSQAPPVAGAYNGSTVYQIAALAYCINAAAVTSITVTTTGVSANSSVFAAVSEFSGVPPQATIDGAASANTVATASLETSPSIQVTGSSDVLAACTYFNGTLSSVTAGWTSFDPGFTAAAWQATTAPTSRNITWNFTAPSLYTTSAILALGVPAVAKLPQPPALATGSHRSPVPRAWVGKTTAGGGVTAPPISLTITATATLTGVGTVTASAQVNAPAAGRSAISRRPHGTYGRAVTGNFSACGYGRAGPALFQGTAALTAAGALTATGNIFGGSTAGSLVRRRSSARAGLGPRQQPGAGYAAAAIQRRHSDTDRRWHGHRRRHHLWPGSRRWPRRPPRPRYLRPGSSRQQLRRWRRQ